MGRGRHNADRVYRAALAALVALWLCAGPVWAHGQHGGAASRPAPAPRAGGVAQAPRQQAARPQVQLRANGHVPNGQFQGRVQGGVVQGGVVQRPGYPPTGYPNGGYVRPGYPASAAPGSAYRAPAPYPAQVRPYTYPGAAPAGHLGDWLNQHRSLPAPEQERALRSDPSFRRLQPSEQDRLVQQLHHVNQLPEEQRQRRLARNEVLEHMAPQEQMRVYNSMRRLNTLPQDRRAMLGNAFRDLRAVPMDQRATVLNSSRYQNTFSPDERGILSDVLRAEPYEPAR